MKSKKKICKGCGEKLERKYRESFAYFDARMFCCKKCMLNYRIGENHPRWNGYTGLYATIHSWLKNNYKKTGKCTVCGKIKGTRTQWSLKKDKEYCKNIDNFTEMCGSCHKKYDMNEETRKRMSMSAKNRRKK